MGQWGLKGAPKGAYSILRDVECILVSNGWDYTAKDSNGKTFFDRYPNKAEAKRAFKSIVKCLKHQKNVELAYSDIEEEYER